MRALNHEVATLQSVFLCIGGKLVHEVLLLQIVCQLLHRVVFVQLLSVLVHIGKGILDNQSAQRSLLVVRGHIRCILSNEDVGRNATTSVNGTSDGCMILLALVLDAVLREELTMLITGQQVLFIVLVVTSYVRFLDTTSRGRIIAGNGQTNHRLIVEGNRLLNQSFTKRATSDNRTTIIVLNGTSQNL